MHRGCIPLQCIGGCARAEHSGGERTPWAKGAAKQGRTAGGRRRGRGRERRKRVEIGKGLEEKEGGVVTGYGIPA